MPLLFMVKGDAFPGIKRYKIIGAVAYSDNGMFYRFLCPATPHNEAGLRVWLGKHPNPPYPSGTLMYYTPYVERPAIDATLTQDATRAEPETQECERQDCAEDASSRSDAGLPTVSTVNGSAL